MSDTQAKDHCAPSSERSQKEAAKKGYVRARDLPKLLPLWPSEVGAMSIADHARLLAKLRRALRSERQRGLGGHWSYDLARHAQLLRAYRAETDAYLRAVEASRRRIAV
jgi:hypothetical protein